MSVRVLILSALTGAFLFSTNPILRAGGPGEAGAPVEGETIKGGPLMTPEERAQFQEKMRSLKTPEQRRAFMEEHRKKMEERAKERGMPGMQGMGPRGGGMGPGGMGPGGMGPEEDEGCCGRQ